MKNKKFILAIMLLTLLLLVVLVACYDSDDNVSEKKESPDFEFTEKADGTYELTNVSNIDMNIVQIPATYNNKPVSSIASLVFAYNTDLIRIEIPDSITQIGEYAFMDSKAEIFWGENPSITTLGTKAFYKYKGKSLIIPDSVTAIGQEAFNECTSEIKWGENPQITKIGESAFLGSKITQFAIPESVTEIGDSAFRLCSELESITLGKNVTVLGSGIFGECENLDKIYYNGSLEDWCNLDFYDRSNNPMENAKSLYINGELLKDKLIIPDTIKQLKDYTFYNCKEITSVEIPDNVNSVGEYTFLDCSNLKTVNLGKGLTKIARGTFSGSGITNLVVPENITAIEDFAFMDCDFLVNINISAGVTSISENAFSGCECLTNIEVDASNSIYSSVDNCLIEIKSKTLVLGGVNGAIPSDGIVNTIGYEAFSGRKGLLSINIPESIKFIEDSAFSNCDSLTEVVIPDSVLSINNFAFSGCANLVSIFIPLEVGSIGMFAFGDCDNLTIYCEATEKPNGWSSMWNIDERPVIWGYTAE